MTPRPSAAIRASAVCSCGPQSHRAEWNTSPVRHDEWSRTSRPWPSPISPRTSATCSLPFVKSSYAWTSKSPNSVGSFACAAARTSGRPRAERSFARIVSKTFKAYASVLHMSARWLHGFALVAALLLLDVSLTFHNVWPTPAISWRGEISVELAAYIIGCALLTTRLRSRSISSTALRWITVVWIFLVVGRYADVTAASLFGRDINLYWD